MRVLIDLLHPAHVHFFRNVVRRLRSDGHRVLLTGRRKDVLVELAARYGLRPVVFGTSRPGLLALGAELIYRDWRLLGIARSFRPDCMMGVAGTCVSGVGRLLGIPTYVFYDTEHAFLSNLLAYPPATCLYVPRSYRRPIRWRHRRYAGNHELAYLHPRYFTPDASVAAAAGFPPEEPYTIVRFVAWQAAHDVGAEGLSTEAKRRAVRRFGELGRLGISSEGPLPPDLEKFRLRVEPDQLHHLLAYASLVFGESSTVCAEAAVLGTPAVYLDDEGRGYIDELRRYGLVFDFPLLQAERALEKATEILRNSERDRWRSKARRLAHDKIDVTQMVYRVATERPFVGVAHSPMGG